MTVESGAEANPVSTIRKKGQACFVYDRLAPALVAMGLRNLNQNLVLYYYKSSVISKYLV